MRHDNLERELYLIELLAENRKYSVDDLCKRIGISKRSLYYYFDFFKDCGFRLYKHGNYYSLDRNSPFFANLIDRISFTEEEAIVIRRLLDKVDQGNALVNSLKQKLDRFYDFDILTNNTLREQTVKNIRTLYDAIKFQRQVVLHNYSSPHSNTTKDRYVEPFMLMNNNNEVRCYEPSSQLNKTFKVSRMQNVEMLNMEWAYTQQHREMFTDVFMFSGEQRMPVTLLLGTLAYNLMREEFPQTAAWMQQQPDGRRLLQLEVCSYAGIGRFVLGLYNDIEVLGDSGFIVYLHQQITAMAQKEKDSAARTHQS